MEEEPHARTPLRERPIDEVATALQEMLGQTLTAYAIREKDPKRIGVFARAEDTPDEEPEIILRDLAQITEDLTENSSPAVARAILIGRNPLLDDQSPIQLIHKGGYDAVLNAGGRLIASDGS